MSRSWAKGSTRAWRTLRAAILAANRQDNGGRCQLAIRGTCTGDADQVHHTRGKAVTGDDPRHLVACCRACNLHVGNPARTHRPRPRPTSKW
jgi:5-methylcytosine-specific restriction endonuclease McrA